MICHTADNTPAGIERRADMGSWRTVALSLAGLVLLTVGCQEQVVILSVQTEGVPDPNGSPFVAFMLIERTFTEGTSVVTQH